MSKMDYVFAVFPSTADDWPIVWVSFYRQICCYFFLLILVVTVVFEAGTYWMLGGLLA